MLFREKFILTSSLQKLEHGVISQSCLYLLSVQDNQSIIGEFANTVYKDE